MIGLCLQRKVTLDTSELTDGYKIRRTAVDFSIPLISNIKNATLMVDSFEKVGLKADWTKLPDFAVRSWDEYMSRSHLTRSG